VKGGQSGDTEQAELRLHEILCVERRVVGRAARNEEDEARPARLHRRRDCGDEVRLRVDLRPPDCALFRLRLLVEDLDEPLLVFGFRLDVFEPAFDRWLLDESLYEFVPAVRAALSRKLLEESGAA